MDDTDVVVGIDGSISAAGALRWAADEAVRRTSRLVIMHASAVVDSAAYTSASLQMMRSDAAVHGERVLKEAAMAATGQHRRLPVTTLLRHEHAADALIALSGQGALVVVGSRGANRVVGTLLGSVSQRVAAHATGTVVVVGSKGPIQSTKLGILVGVSGSNGGRAALDFACAEAAVRACQVTAVRAYGRSRHGLADDPQPGRRAAQARALGEAVDWMRARYPQVAVEARLINQAPAQALATLGRDAALLVLGCRNPAGHRSSRLDPIAAGLLHSSPCPVAVVGNPQPATAEPEADPAAAEALTSGAWS
jgi:nucleotide-binding universal stress UspA family protein